MLTANKVGGVEDGDKLIEKYGKLSKTGKLSKSNKKLSKFKKPLMLEHTFILAFINI